MAKLCIPEITDAKARLYTKDIIAFLNDQYVLPETRKLIKLEPWQKDYILRPLFYDLDSQGHRKYNVALIGVPKKNGKSALAVGVGVYVMYAGEPFGEVIVAANARDQASMIIFNRMRYSVKLNPNLESGTFIGKDIMEVRSTGTIARCVAHQYETAAGLNPNLTLFDELWGFSDRRFYDELTVVPTRVDPLVLIVTYAGYEQQGLLWDLYSDGMAGEPIMDTGDPDIMVRRGAKDPRMFMFWSHKNLASWVKPEYVEGQRRRLPPEVFARLHENRWVPASSEFITSADIAALYAHGWDEQLHPRIDRPLSYIVATDVGLSHDRTARVVGHYDPLDLKLYLDSIRVWEGSSEKHVDIKEVEADLVECAHRFKARKLVIDPWQMEYVIQRLQGIYNVVPFNATSDMQHLSQIFVNMLRGHRIVAYREPFLPMELKDAIIRQTGQGWRIDHYGKRRNDVVIATGMMMLEAVRGQYGSIGNMPDEGDDAPGPVAMRGVRGKEF